MRRLPAFFLVFAVLPVSLAAQKIHVTNPIAGVTWVRGSSQEITWTRTGSMDSNVRIVLLRADGTSEGRIVNRTPNDGSYTWEIPADTEPGSYKIRLVTVDGAVRDTSGNFTILLAAVYTSPSGIHGEGHIDVETSVVGHCDFGIESVTFADGTTLNYGIPYPRSGDLSGIFQVIALWNGNPPPASDCSYSVEVWNTMTNGVCGRSTNPHNFTHSNADSTKRVRVNVPFTILAENVYRSIGNRAIPLEFRLVASRNGCDHDAPNNRRPENMRLLNIPTASDFAVEIVPDSFSCSESHRGFGIRVQFRIRFRAMNVSRADSGAPASPVNNVKYKYHIAIPSPKYPNQREMSSEGTFPVVSSTAWTEKSIEGTFQWVKNWWAPMYFVLEIDPDEEFFDPNRSNNSIRYEFRLPPI